MKVALACNNFPPEFEGGTERVTRALALALQGLGHDVVVIAGSDAPHRGADVVFEDSLGLPVYRLPRHGNEGYGLELGRPRLLGVTERLLREHGVDVLHLHHWATLSLETLRSARRHGIATVATLHDMWTACPRFFRRPPPGIRCPTGTDREPCGRCARIDLDTQPLWKLRLGVANRDREVTAELAAAQALTAPSRSCAEKVARDVPWAGPIEVVPHGLLEPVKGPPAPAPRQPLRIGTFGHLVRDKGVRVLVEAMAGLRGAELHLFGAFLDASFEREILALAGSSGVPLVCHGPYTAGDRHPARELDLAVFPSLCEETYGLVVEEALARGVPVVVSDLGALRERIGDGGVVTPAGDVALLRAELRSLLADPGRHAGLRRRIPRQFRTIGDAAARYVEIYDQVRAG